MLTRCHRWRTMRGMQTLERIKLLLGKAHIPTVHKETGVPLRSLYGYRAGRTVPSRAAEAILAQWAKHKRLPGTKES